MAHPAASLYNEDYHAWAVGQAEALSRLAENHWNGPLDLDHLAEEVEDLGKAERNSVLSQVERIIEHALKLEHAASALPDACPYTLVQLLDENWFPANRHGLTEPV